MNYPIHERFLSFQGEGDHMGRRAFFIRTMGCPVKCPFCDSAGTWHKDWIPPEKNLMSVEQLVAEVKEANPEFVVLTGGEPAIHNLAPLVDALDKACFPVHLETSGAFPFTSLVTWVTLSPKKWKMPIAENIIGAHEIKIIVEAPEDIEFYLKGLQEIAASDETNFIAEAENSDLSIWLHPEWSKSADPVVLNAICKAVTENKTMLALRAGYQLHKLFKVDATDARTRPLVPLGGDMTRGF